MSNFRLNLPTDIPWKRICVTDDMIAQKICDERLPAKWQSSIGVFKYKPEEEYQQFPDYDITYLKVTATITGYQPLDKEIQGEIDWEGVDVSTVSGLTDLLNSYDPCHGAILQVVVAPKDKESDQDTDDYPFFLDFEPKKRELYELATDTREKSSRSVESLNITKSAGSAQSTEVLDVDMGGGGFGAQGSYGGTGGGFNYTESSGQWGTKRLNTDESMRARSSDVGQEKRESFAFSTQISQMYHLLNSYHLGTNRVVFFVQPRPHTLEEPSGFVRGPRPVEGIQEFFMVIAHPKDQDDFCVSLRLDTSHLTKTQIMDYDYKSDVTDIANAQAPIPTENDTMGNREKWGTASFGATWDVYYQCHLTHDEDSVTYQAPEGYEIEGYDDLVNTSSYGSSEVKISQNNSSLSIHAEANGKNCFKDSLCASGCPDNWQKRSGSARRQVQVNLVSKEPIREVGEEETLMITTRGLCCCASEDKKTSLDEFVVDFKEIPREYKPIEFDLTGTQRGAEAEPVGKHRKQRTTGLAQSLRSEKEAGSGKEPCEECGDAARGGQQPSNKRYSIRQVNELSNWIKDETLKSLNNPVVKLKKFAETDFFARKLENRMVQSEEVRSQLRKPASGDLPKKAISKLEKRLRKKADQITRADLFTFRTEELQKITGIPESQALRFKLESLGVKFKGKPTGSAPGGSGRGKKKK